MGLLILVVISYFLVSRIMKRICSSKEDYNDSFLFFMMFKALISSCINDALSAQSIVETFIYGLMLLKGKLTQRLSRKLNTYVYEIMLPILFASCGIGIGFNQNIYVYVVILVTCMACLAKYIGSLTVSKIFKMPI